MLHAWSLGACVLQTDREIMQGVLSTSRWLTHNVYKVMQPTPLGPHQLAMATADKVIWEYTHSVTQLGAGLLYRHNGHINTNHDGQHFTRLYKFSEVHDNKKEENKRSDKLYTLSKCMFK